MKILLLGATGRTGKHVLKAALSKNYTVNCLVRKIPTQQFPGVTFFQGNPSDAEVLSQAMNDCEAVVSALNISRTSDFPWSKLRTPENFLSDVMTKTISLAHQHNIQRIIVCSAWGVAETRNDIPKWFKWFIENSNINPAYQDHERQEKLLTQSDLHWTIVRPTGLTNSNKPQTIIESYRNNPNPMLTISRQSVAQYMIDALGNKNLVGKSPVISARSIFTKAIFGSFRIR